MFPKEKITVSTFKIGREKLTFNKLVKLGEKINPCIEIPEEVFSLLRKIENMLIGLSKAQILFMASIQGLVFWQM